MTKYPDKKQIEDKLHQIREYLKITNSLMTSMKNDDQVSKMVLLVFLSLVCLCADKWPNWERKSGEND